MLQKCKEFSFGQNFVFHRIPSEYKVSFVFLNILKPSIHFFLRRYASPYPVHALSFDGLG